MDSVDESLLLLHYTHYVEYWELAVGLVVVCSNTMSICGVLECFFPLSTFAVLRCPLRSPALCVFPSQLLCVLVWCSFLLSL